MSEDILAALRNVPRDVRFHGRGKLRAETKLSPSRSGLHYKYYEFFSDVQSSENASGA